MPLFRYSLIVAVIFLAVPVNAKSPTKFDKFGDINCEEEYARLDNFAIQLQQTPNAQGIILFYEGRRFRGRLPRKGEGSLRAARLKPYLVNQRGIPADRVIVIHGGYQETFSIELWITPAGGGPPQPNGTVPASEIKFRKGRVSKRQFQCNI